MQFCFEGSKSSSFCQHWEFFKHLLVVLKHFFFFLVDFCCCYALVCLLQCCLLPSSFVILMSRWFSPIKPFALTLFPLFFIKRSHFFFKNKKLVLTWYFSCSWARRFVVFFFCVSLFRFHYTFAGGSVKYFWMLFFLTRWCWVDEGFVLILGGVQCVFAFCIDEDEQTFPPLQVYNMSG